MKNHDDIDGEEIIIRSLKQPNPVKVEIKNNEIKYIIEKELGIELVGDIKVKIEANEEDDNWDDIVEERSSESVEETIEKEVKEDYIKEDVI